MVENSYVAFGSIATLDPISGDGYILIKNSEEKVFIEKRFNDRDLLIFNLLGNEEFKFKYKNIDNKNVFITYLVNDEDQLEIKEKVLIRYANKFSLSEINVQELVKNLGFTQKGTMAFLESLKLKKSLDYRITGPGQFAISIKSKSIQHTPKNETLLNPLQQLYKNAEKLTRIQNIEFQKSMNIDSLRKQFLEKSWDEVIHIINQRIEIDKSTLLKEITEAGMSDKSFIEIRKSNDEKEREDNYFLYGFRETNKERTQRLKKKEQKALKKEKQLALEREKNKKETGKLETNEERAKRENIAKYLSSQEKEREHQERKLALEREKNKKETGKLETNEERAKRENIAEIIVVNADKIDAQRNKKIKKARNKNVRQFDEKINYEEYINKIFRGEKSTYPNKRSLVNSLTEGMIVSGHVVNISDRGIWVLLGGYTALLPSELSNESRPNLMRGDLIGAKVYKINKKNLQITLQSVNSVTKIDKGQLSIEELASELKINPTKLRKWLRDNYPRKAEDKNKKWVLNNLIINDARNAFNLKPTTSTKKPSTSKKTTVKKSTTSTKKPSTSKKTTVKKSTTSTKKPAEDIEPISPSLVPYYDLSSAFHRAELHNKNKNSTKLFAYYVKEALVKYGKDETSLTFPSNKNKFRLINSGIESAWINNMGLMTVVINDYNTSEELKYLIKNYVHINLRKDAYKKFPAAVPLFIPHISVKRHSKVLKKSFDIFLDQVYKTGKNPWKKYHDKRIIDLLNLVLFRKIKS